MIIPFGETNAIDLDEANLIQAPIKIKIPTAIIRVILDITVISWSKLISNNSILPTMLENKIAGYLRREMKIEKDSRPELKNQIRIEQEVGTFASQDSIEPEGRIDIKIIYSFTEEEYFSMECKRVSSDTKGKDKELARKYITNGIMRFIEGIYSPGHDFAAMIGFVIDNKPQKCINRICKFLNKSPYKENILLKENWTQETNFGNYNNLYHTIHEQKNHNSLINILHLFLEL